MKRIVEIKRGKPIPDGARWIKDVERIVGWEDSGHWQLNDSPIYATFDVFEVEAGEMPKGDGG